MSNFYLCDMCDNNVIDVFLETCHCRAMGMEHVSKKVMYDYGCGGPEGIYGYKEPKEVCEHYEPRRDG